MGSIHCWLHGMCCQLEKINHRLPYPLNIKHMLCNGCFSLACECNRHTIFFFFGVLVCIFKKKIVREQCGMYLPKNKTISIKFQWAGCSDTACCDLCCCFERCDTSVDLCEAFTFIKIVWEIQRDPFNVFDLVSEMPGGSPFLLAYFTGTLKFISTY